MKTQMTRFEEVLDMGNGEALRRGVVKIGERRFLAVSFAASREFKTERAARRWLARRWDS